MRQSLGFFWSMKFHAFLYNSIESNQSSWNWPR